MRNHLSGRSLVHGGRKLSLCTAHRLACGESLMDPRNIWLSILLPVYNVESHLAECIHSIVQQAGIDEGVEIIMVDDGSTDGSRLLAGRLCAQFPHQLRLVCHNRNLGVSAARNRLLDEARGKFVWFIDPDDYMLRRAIEELRSIVGCHDPDLILCDYRKNRFWKRRSFFGPARRLSDDMRHLVRGVFKSRKMYCWVKISRRSLWLDSPRFPDGRVFEDIATIPWLLLKARYHYYIPAAWVHYRQRTGSIMDSVRRQPYLFDAGKHDDMAQALRGYKDELRKCFGAADPAIDYHVADFCAKEFTKTAHRIIRAGQTRKAIPPEPDTLARFRSLWEACSPIPFDHLTGRYLTRFRFIRYILLRSCLQKSRVRRNIDGYLVRRPAPK